MNCHIWFSNYSTLLFFTGSLGVERCTWYTQVEASKEESEIRSNSKKSLAEIIFLSTVKIRRTAKLWFLKSVVQHWKWRLCESTALRRPTKYLVRLCHSRILSPSTASEPPILFPHHLRLAVFPSAIRWKWARAKISPGTLCESCPTPPDWTLYLSHKK